MKYLFIFFFNFCLFFLFSTTFVYAQVFSPKIDRFNSSLDGLWEFIEPLSNYLISVQEKANYSSNVFYDLDFWGNVTAEDELFIFNKESDFLVNNYLKVFFSSAKENFVLNFSFLCETAEDSSGFDDPFLVIFLDDQLIFKESDLTICKEWQENFLLLNLEGKDHELYFFAGNNGDKEKNTIIKIKDIKLLKNLSNKLNNLKNDNLVTVIDNPEKQSVISVAGTKSYNYPSPPIFHNFNEKPAITGQILGENDQKPTIKDVTNDYLIAILPIFMGIVVFLVSFYFFTLLSAWLVKLKAERKKINE